jgi:ubiquinone/menaquinone biosynthesis C-methylase UbiE
MSKDGFVPADQTAADFFGERIPEYDSLIRRAVPGYDELTAALVEELPPQARRVLELGCGTGNLTLRLAMRLPDAELTVVDASPEMVETTRLRLQARAPAVEERATFLVARFEDVELPAAGFDLVTSAIALHHVADKAPLYRRMREVLRPGGRCCFADQLRMAQEDAQQRHWAEFLNFWRQPGHVSEAEFHELLEHSRAHDHYESVDRQFALLRDAGFRELDMPWRVGLWGVITATA